MILSQLRELILADEALSSLAAAGSDNTIAGVLNEPSIDIGRYISRSELEKFLIGQGIAAVAEIYGANPAVPIQLRVACLSMGKMLASKEFPQLNLDDPATMAMQGGLVAGGVMSQTQSDALFALSARSYKSIAESTFGRSVSSDEVSECLLGHRTIGG